MNTVKACPFCGQLVENHCHHDGDDVAPVVMTRGNAAQLLRRTIAAVQDEMSELLDDLLKVTT